jgi:hypothetical protein
MVRSAVALLLAALSSNAAAAWVIVRDNDEYIAYADPATILRDGDNVRMSDLVDLKFPRPSPYGNQHASSMAHSEFDCQNPRVRTLAFSLHSGQMGNGDRVETVAESIRWLPIAPGTLLDALWQFACGST